MTTQTSFKSPLLNQLAERLAKIRRHAEPLPSAVLIAITDEENPKILYTLRASHLSHHAGEVSFAGGKREENDTNNASVALREMWEETGISPEFVTVIGELPFQHAKSGMPVLPVVGVIPPDVAITPEVGEIARVFWGDLATVAEQATVEYRLGYQGHQIVSPSFIVDGETVWGLTGRITASLLEIGFDRQIAWEYKMKPLA